MRKEGKSFSGCLSERYKLYLVPICVLVIAVILLPLLFLICQYIAPDWSPLNPSYSRTIQCVSTIMIFGVPGIAFAFVANKKPLVAISADNFSKGINWIYLILFIAVSIPAINLISELNDSISFPDSMKSFETRLRESHQEIEAQSAQMLVAESIHILLVNLLVLALVPAVCEELFFRGWIQHVLTKSVNPHLAIWITAVIFSILHFQFYAFLPRLMIGAAYGYILYRSGSLWMTIAAHFINNGAIVILSYMEQHGNGIVEPDYIGTGSSFAVGIASIALSLFLISRITPPQPQEDKNLAAPHH